MIIGSILKDVVKEKSIRLNIKPNSKSMEPLLSEEAILVVSYIKGKIHKGDLCVMAFDGDEIVCHRVIKVKGDFILTKGDNNYIYDRHFEKINVIGRVLTITYKNYYIDLTSTISRRISWLIALISQLANTERSFKLQQVKFIIAKYLISLIIILYKKIEIGGDLNE